MTTRVRREASRLNPEWFELQADMLRVMANPKRLMILDALESGPKTVTELASLLEITLQNTSQHLRTMRTQRIVRAERRGRTLRYRLTSPVFGRCCGLVRKVLVEQAMRGAERLTSAETRSRVPLRRLARTRLTPATTYTAPAVGAGAGA